MQTDIADATGLTPVHVNRVLRDLREDGCRTMRDGHLSILNRDRLHRRGEFDPAYLYLPGADAALWRWPRTQGHRGVRSGDRCGRLGRLQRGLTGGPGGEQPVLCAAVVALTAEPERIK